MTPDPIIKRWHLLSVIAAALCTGIAGFLLPPPIPRNHTYHFALFLTTLIVALWYAPISIWVGRPYLKRWATASVLLIIVTFGGYLGYGRLLSLWTFGYPSATGQEERAVMGITLSEDAAAKKRELIANGKPAGPRELVWEAGGGIADVWPIDSEREKRQEALEILYLVLVLVCASTVICSVQTTLCVR